VLAASSRSISASFCDFVLDLTRVNAAPAFNTPKIATTASTELSMNSMTRCPGRTRSPTREAAKALLARSSAA
jgi:hypothetical protein